MISQLFCIYKGTTLRASGTSWGCCTEQFSCEGFGTLSFSPRPVAGARCGQAGIWGLVDVSEGFLPTCPEATAGSRHNEVSHNGHLDDPRASCCPIRATCYCSGNFSADFPPSERGVACQKFEGLRRRRRNGRICNMRSGKCEFLFQCREPVHNQILPPSTNMVRVWVYLVFMFIRNYSIPTLSCCAYNGFLMS